ATVSPKHSLQRDRPPRRPRPHRPALPDHRDRQRVRPARLRRASAPSTSPAPAATPNGATASSGATANTSSPPSLPRALAKSPSSTSPLTRLATWAVSPPTPAFPYSGHHRLIAAGYPSVSPATSVRSDSPPST